MVDRTNVKGGQLFLASDIDERKAYAVMNICERLGTTNAIIPMTRKFENSDLDSSHIVITGVDNMAARRQVFEAWRARISLLNDAQREEAVLIDGRLTMEMYEIFTIRATDPEAIEAYEKEHLFTDSEAQELDCTTKQSTWCAMGIGAEISAVLCNHLVNVKWQDEVREIDSYIRMFYPIGDYTRRKLKSTVKQSVCLQQEASGLTSEKPHLSQACSDKEPCTEILQD